MWEKLKSVCRFLGKNLLRWLASSLAIAVLVVLLCYPLIALESWGRGSSLKQVDGLLPPVVSDRIFNSSFDLLGASAVGGGSGYLLPGTNLMITNYHVASALCPIRDCSVLLVESRSRNGRGQKMVQSAFNAHTCSRWLDVCLLVPASKEDPIPENIRYADVNVGQEIYVAARVSDGPEGKLVFAGTVDEVSPDLITASLFSKAGFSGSPAFNKEGTFIGLLKANRSRHLIQPQEILEVIGLKTHGWYKSKTELIPAAALASVTLCSAGPSRCLIEELRLFISTTEYFLENKKNDLVARALYPLNAAQFWNDFQVRLNSISEMDEDIVKLRLLLSKATSLNFNQVAMREMLADEFWYKVHLSMLLNDLSVTGYYSAANLAAMIRSNHSSPASKFQAQFAEFLDLY